MHASTWASAGLGVALGGFGRRGGLGSLVVSLAGAWGACGGPGERRRDGVRVFSANAQHDIHEVRRATKSKAQEGFLRLQVLESRERKRFVPLADTTGRNLGLKSPPGEIPNFGASHEIFHTHLRFRAILTCRHAAISTCRDGALDGSVRRDLQVTQTGDLGLEQAARQEEDVST